MKIHILLLVIVYFLASCEKDSDSPPSEFTLDSEPNRGFSFESLNIIDYTNISTAQPDFIVLALVNAQGDVLSPFLSHPDYEHRFLLSDEFQSLDEAQAHYDAYSPPANKPFQEVAGNIKPFQVWLIKRNDGGFGKVLVTKTRALKKADNTAFAEMTFKAGKIQ